jgi:ribosomal-protein-alanine N-acetyltransferase
MSESFFTTPRLSARRFSSQDLGAFVAMRADPEVARYQNWDSFTEKEGQEFLDWIAPRHPGEAGWFQFVLEDQHTMQFIGDCGLNILDSATRFAQIGYTVARPFWNRGYATEAITGLVKYAFSTFPLHRISASVDPLNTGSARALEKAGFVKEAHFRQTEWFKGRWADDAIYAMLREDWRTSG